MEPIERVRARASAFDLLGVNHGSDAEEIRAAWRRVAFEMHPDRHGGDQSRFVRAKGAYDFLLQDEAHAYSGYAVAREATETARRSIFRGRDATRVAARRPHLALRLEALSPEVREACQALLVPQEGAPSIAAHLRLHDDAPEDTCGEAARHVAAEIERHGRHLTYILPSVLRPGLNTVALPTAILESRRRPRPDVLAISTRDAITGDVRIPDAICAQLFPGARVVCLRFGETPRVGAPAQP